MELGGLRMRLRPIGPACAIVALFVLLTACTEDGTAGATMTLDPTSPDSQIGSPQSGPSAVWLAGLRVEVDPEDLQADTREIMDEAGSAIFAGPVSCFDSVPAEFVPAPDAYVLGLVAPSKEELDEAVDRVGREPIFVEQVTNTCVD
jgi:hypothetical protein